MTRAWTLFLIIMTALVALGAPALGHGGHDENIRVIGNDRGTQVRFVVSAEELLWFDTDRDGLLSRGEFDRQQDRIDAYVDLCLDARTQNGLRINPDVSDHPISGYGSLRETDPVASIRFIRGYAAGSQLAQLDFTCFPGTHGSREVISAGDLSVSASKLTNGEFTVELF